MNKPQLSAEMEKRFDDKFHCGQVGCNCADGIGSIVAVKHFLATALEEQRQMIYSLPPISLYRKLKSENDAIVLGILAECKKHNAKPTLEQIRETMGAKSLTTVQRSLARLEKIGLVKRDKYKKRSWEALLTQKEDK